MSLSLNAFIQFCDVSKWMIKRLLSNSAIFLLFTELFTHCQNTSNTRSIIAVSAEKKSVNRKRKKRVPHSKQKRNLISIFNFDSKKFPYYLCKRCNDINRQKMENKKISIATVASRMNRILAAYREQCGQETDDAAAPTVVASTSSSSSSSSSSSKSSTGGTNCSTERSMVLDKAILNYAAQSDNVSDADSDSSDRSYAYVDSPYKRRSRSGTYMTTTKTTNDQQSKRRRQQPSRTVKRAAEKLTTLPSKRVQRKVTCTITSNASPDRSSESSESPMSVVFPDSDDSDAEATAKPMKSSLIFKKTSKSRA